MNPIRQLHNQAMDLVDQALVAKHHGDQENFLHLSHEAFKLEAQAAGLVADNLEAEPTRSVLHRSAATLALNCGEFSEAERLVAVALAGNPPLDIAEELQDVLKQVYSARQLAVPKTKRASMNSILNKLKGISANEIKFGFMVFLLISLFIVLSILTSSPFDIVLLLVYLIIHTWSIKRKKKR